jgi:predicted esterase
VKVKLLVLHGFTQNGEVLRAHMADLSRQLPEHVTCSFPDAPHACSEESTRRLQAMLRSEQAAPYLCWWNATDDGRLYRGYEQSLALLKSAVSDGEPFGVLGFSQGAVLAATLAALAQRGEFARPAFVALVAGRVPRAEALAPFFEGVLSVPSLHVWGERDVMAKEWAPQLADKFDPETREVVRWNGPHVLPTFGPAADALVTFVRNRACN